MTGGDVTRGRRSVGDDGGRNAGVTEVKRGARAEVGGPRLESRGCACAVSCVAFDAARSLVAGSCFVRGRAGSG